MTKKLAISLPDQVAEQVRRAVDNGRAPSVSAYIAEALQAYEEPQDYDELIAEWVREAGPPPPGDVAWVQGALAASDRASRRRWGSDEPS